MEKGCNGWKNRQTWNVSLWINNGEALYRKAVDFMKTHIGCKSPYKAFIKFAGLENEKTGDGYRWISKALDYKALDDMMQELL